MINEERVRQLNKIALYEKNEENLNREIGQFYKSDYVGKELIKSIFTGTFACGCFAILWLLGAWEDVLEKLNSLELTGMIVNMITFYLVFMVIYLFATYVVYSMRYEARKKKLKEYTSNLKTMHKMYEREEKLKM